MTVSIFDKTLSFLSKALDIMSLRHQIIASNIANQDTPNYKAKDITFREEFEAALNVKGAISGSDISDVEGRIIMRSERGAGYDNNSVNVELEMARMAENTIMYNAAAQILSNKLKTLSYVIKEGR